MSELAADLGLVSFAQSLIFKLHIWLPEYFRILSILGETTVRVPCFNYITGQQRLPNFVITHRLCSITALGRFETPSSFTTY